MGSQLPETSLKKLTRNNMTNEVKDTAATVSTIVGGGAFVMGINELLTLALLVTGIILNIIRIRDIRKDKKKED
jgi:thiamine pyrophosphate-dependent acetolactate synthase large subunit-like protein